MFVNYTINEYKSIKFYKTNSLVYKKYLEFNEISQQYEDKLNSIWGKVPVVSTILRIKGNKANNDTKVWEKLNDAIGGSYLEAVKLYDELTIMKEEGASRLAFMAKDEHADEIKSKKIEARRYIGQTISECFSAEESAPGELIAYRFNEMRNILEADRKLMFDEAIHTILVECDKIVGFNDSASGDSLEIGTIQTTEEENEIYM
ncbi:MAG: hypothetical protein N4A47_04030 [Clostridia bacterium]|jgi:hypothetical protein|nr:hypothetical protein [Clostridia bacterium]